MLSEGTYYVAIYEDGREQNPCRIYPAICGVNPGDSILFANHTDEEVSLHFAQWPFSSGTDPITLAAGATQKKTLGAIAKPGDVFLYNAKCHQGKVEAEGSRPIIIIYK
jgi:hypothetical protein